MRHAYRSLDVGIRTEPLGEGERREQNRKAVEVVVLYVKTEDEMHVSLVTGSKMDAGSFFVFCFICFVYFQQKQKSIII